ncbi:hypothetical protein [Neobacillus sp. 19]|uniref:hypothetical protein n=1 Tax=Neobacillus sp. 19 TaxID=3394458 RepID=UPI003BF73341
MPKINVKDWRNLPTHDWNVTTFRQYLSDQHEQRYGIKYTARSFAIEARWLKSMIAEHGTEVVKSFIDACFNDYKPTAQYPGLNFSFMFSYQRARILPRVLADIKRRQAVQQAVEETEDLSDWL